MKKICFVLCLVFLFSSLGLGSNAASEKPFDGYNQNEWEVLRYTNKERISRGIPPLSMYDKVQGVASVREAEIRGFYNLDHLRPDGRKWNTAFMDAGITYNHAGENIASGYVTPPQVIAAWMESPSHRENIFRDSFCHMGAGASSDRYWVQSFMGTTACKFSGLSLVLPDGNMFYDFDFDKSNIVLTVRCKEHGDCVLPISSEMCTLEPSGISGIYHLQVRCYGLYTSERVYDGYAPAFKGDVNRDRQLTAADAVRLKRYLAGWNVRLFYPNADIDGDSEISTRDCVILTRVLAGWKI